MKKILIFIGLILFIFPLASCKLAKDTIKEVTLPINEEIDPLKAARLELFNEIGIEEGKTENKEDNNLPPVILPPPALPATDVNIY